MEALCERARAPPVPEEAWSTVAGELLSSYRLGADGAHGVAVAAAICHAPDPPTAARAVVDGLAGS